ncbi:4-carboxymuconolactone decarboxylase [Rhodobacter viridis]|uniref:4-carboxymuconolactone decarboxylase n=1 Tax=Rhodobacter viridis TaxID=1054202 RepID=A0A318UA72_9RHOB|nr:carboxymuconolactone decarboxylase family protein [Rhodobacter viridis]PYF12801.1 4-carboxymuconolactone decarboxylase [Rhodobacter viridis]
MNTEFQKLFMAMMEQGTEMARMFNPALESFNPRAFEKMFPTMPADVLEMFFGKTFNRDGLDARTRLLVTLAGQVTLGAQAEAPIRLTIRHALEAGATEREIAEVIFQMSMFGGVPAMTKALELAREVFDEKSGENT